MDRLESSKTTMKDNVLEYLEQEIVHAEKRIQVSDDYPWPMPADRGYWQGRLDAYRELKAILTSRDPQTMAEEAKAIRRDLYKMANMI